MFDLGQGDKKVLSLDELVDAVAAAKAQKRTVALCHGVFDLVHPGHIRHLQAASRLADVLVVTVTADRFVNKGPGRPVFTDRLRAENLAALECVGYVAINDAPAAINVITRLEPDVYVKGTDYADAKNDATGMIVEEINAVESRGGKVHFTDELHMSSSQLLNAYFDVFRTETRGWLADLKEKFPVAEITRQLQRLAEMKVLVIGEAIVDEYYFCEGLGKSSKDPILAFKYCTHEAHAGGALAVANHLAGLCGEVGLVTVVGEKDGRDKFIRQHLDPKIDVQLLGQRGAPTIHKRRYVDTHTGSKLFELYTFEESPIGGRTESGVLKAIDARIGDYDLVIVADYGHGLMTSKIVEQVSRGAKFLAVNTQANAGNRGFNTISKYRRADYVCLNGGEVRLEMRSHQGAIRELLGEIRARVDCGKFTVTVGRDGTLHYDAAEGYFEAPALAMSVVDRVGAGDAVLAATSPMVALGVPWEIVGLIGNLAGAEAVAELGNSRRLHVGNLIKHVNSILK